MGVETQSEVALAAKESKVLEYWRKRYLAQAVFVVGVSLGLGAAVVCCASLGALRLFLLILIFAVAYIMVKELREGLQARGEGLVFTKGGEIFDDLMFDVGRGLCENALLTQEVVQGYQVRECRNVMRGKGYWLEEDWFYTVVSSKFIPLNQTVFEGVVLAFAAITVEDNLDGEVSLINGKGVITGKLSAYLHEHGALDCVTTFLTLFQVEKAMLYSADKTLYVWVKTEQRLFYQFSLLKPNTLVRFQRRIEALNEAAKKMLTALNG